MADLSKLSDEELERLAMSKRQRPSLSDLPDSQLEQLARTKLEKDKSFLSKTGDWLIEGLVEIGDEIDSVTGAPTRAAIKAVSEGEGPLGAFAEQFGEDTSKAPTGKELAQDAGVPDNSLSELFPSLYTSDDQEAEEWFKFKKGGPADITASGAAGLGVDILADPTSFLGMGMVKGAKNIGSKVLTKGVAKKPDGVVRSIARNTVNNTKEANNALGRVLNPQRSSNYEKLLQIAQRNKVNPSDLPHAVEFGKNSLPSKLQRLKAESELGEPVLNQMDKAFKQVENALEHRIASIGGDLPKGKERAGAIVREGFDEAVDKLKTHSDITYSNIHKHAPGISLTEESLKSIDSKLNGIEKWGKGKIKRGVKGQGLEEARHMLSVVEAVRNNNGSIKQVVEVMQDIGELAFKSKNYLDQTPKDIKKLRDLYFKLSDGVLNTVEYKLGSEFADRLKENNRVFKDFFEDQSFLKQIGKKNVSDEALFRDLISNGDSKQINALKKILSKEKLQKLKGEYLGSLVSRNIDGEISFRKLSNALDRDRPVLKLFDKSELKEITDIINLYSAMGERVISYSGTGSSNRLWDFISEPVKGIFNSTTADTLTDNYIQKARTFKEREVAKQAAKAASDAKKASRAQSISKITKPLKKILTTDKVAMLAGLSPAVVRVISSQSNTDEIKKGRARWLLDGTYSLYREGLEIDKLEKLIKSKKGQRLIIDVSDRRPGSKGFNKIMEKIEMHIQGSEDGNNSSRN